MLFLLILCMVQCASWERPSGTIVINTMSPFCEGKENSAGACRRTSIYQGFPIRERSSCPDSGLENEVGIYYNHPTFASGDSVIMYVRNYTKGASGTTLFTHKLTGPSGIVKTGHTTVPPTGLYHISSAIARNRIVLTSNVDTDREHWMSQRQSMLKNLTLPLLIIPGTHHSGAYHRDGIDGFTLYLKDILRPWKLTQSETIRDQLVSGIRYLDLRPAMRRGADGRPKFIINHGLVEMMTVQEVVDQVNAFMNTTNEIVIASFTEFPTGFTTSADHGIFIEYLLLTLGPHMHEFNATVGWNVPLEKFWSNNRRLVVIYDGPRHNCSYLWPPIEQLSCKTNDTTKLHSCFNAKYEAIKNSRKLHPTVAQVHLAHNEWNSWTDACFNFDKSLRCLADQIAPYILKWFNEEWYSVANIVAVDFYQATGIVETAIYWNEKRANSPLCKTIGQEKTNFKTSCL